ncbi:MAG: hypothetical protein JO197_16605 [Acidobacteria bacterium]|nr:hypothetical protein [Acidobacteriota bacterium]MBV9475424.1 hypothetical protein [Acidobacteriota bacterium]
MNIDYAALERDIFDGAFRRKLEAELKIGFRDMHLSGVRLPVPSHYASQIAEIVSAQVQLSENARYELYQEVLDAVTAARAAVLGEDDKIVS